MAAVLAHRPFFKLAPLWFPFSDPACPDPVEAHRLAHEALRAVLPVMTE